MRAPIKGYEGLYEADEDGSIYSLPKTFIFPNGAIRKSPERKLKPSENGRGYLIVILQNKGKKYTAKVHRLIAQTFIPNPENKPEVNHKDGIKTNCAKSNLEWNTPSENVNHSIRTGLRDLNKYRGSNNHNAKFTSEQVSKIRADYLIDKQKHWEIANKYGVSRTVISRILNNKSYG